MSDLYKEYGLELEEDPSLTVTETELNEETTEMVQRRYPDRVIPEFPEYISV